MTHPYNKHDYILNRDLTPAERLEPQRKALEHAQGLLDHFRKILVNASDELTEKELDTIAEAVENALRAAENAAFLGTLGFNPRPVRMVSWDESK